MIKSWSYFGERVKYLKTSKYKIPTTSKIDSCQVYV